MNPLVIAYHLIWTVYGWWLPNDPRGSGSKTIRKDILKELGDLHYGRKPIQPANREVRQFQAKARPLLQHPLLAFDETIRGAVADALSEVIQQQRYTCYACSVMPDHVHILMRKHKHLAEEMIELLKEVSRSQLFFRGLVAGDHPIWASGSGWKVFLDEPKDVRRTIGYIENNPLEIGLPKQSWPFVKEYDNWPRHPGHSPNSPYAQRLRAVGRYP